MILMALIPDKMHHDAQKKYFDWMADFELNDLYYNGIIECINIYILHFLLIAQQWQVSTALK